MSPGLDPRQKGPLDAVETSAAENGCHNRASGTIVVEAYIATAGGPVYGHLGNERDADTGGNHPQNAAELITLEGYVRRNARVGAGGDAEVAETMPVAQHDKGFSAETLERK